MNTLQRAEVDRFLSSGNHDNLFEVWPGGTLVERSVYGNATLRRALIAEVLRRTVHAVEPEMLGNLGHKIWARAKFTPMVRGLFPQCERETILDMLECSVIFLTPATIATTLEKTPWLRTAWDLANLYLASFAAMPLSREGQEIVGLSEETTCYIAADYFSITDPFLDYVIHEAVHIFHNCKRKTLGLPATRNREWLLEIDFSKRETFAYACETYNQIMERGVTRLDRDRLLSELEDRPVIWDERVDIPEYIDILRDAVAARNGWKRILERCSPPRPARRD